MGLFSSIKDSFNPFSGGGGGLGSLLGGGNPLSGQRSPIQNEQNEVADRAIERGQAAADLQRERAGILREDAEPLRELRNDNINRLLKLQGIGQEQDISSFYSSPEFTSVRDAALQVQGNNPRQNIELTERADELGSGEFENFRNRIRTTAGFSSSGLADTNRLLQQSIDSQVNSLNNAGSVAANALTSGAQARGQGASSLAAALASFSFSDPRLKDNTKIIGFYDIGIPKYTWDWTDDALEIVGDQVNVGPMADQVQEIMPDNVTTINGYLAIKDMELIH